MFWNAVDRWRVLKNNQQIKYNLKEQVDWHQHAGARERFLSWGEVKGAATRKLPTRKFQFFLGFRPLDFENAYAEQKDAFFSKLRTSPPRSQIWTGDCPRPLFLAHASMQHAKFHALICNVWEVIQQHLQLGSDLTFIERPGGPVNFLRYPHCF